MMWKCSAVYKFSELWQLSFEVINVSSLSFVVYKYFSVSSGSSGWSFSQLLAKLIIYDYVFSKNELNFNINNKVQSVKFLKWAE